MDVTRRRAHLHSHLRGLVDDLEGEIRELRRGRTSDHRAALTELRRTLDQLDQLESVGGSA